MKKQTCVFGRSGGFGGKENSLHEDTVTYVLCHENCMSAAILVAQTGPLQWLAEPQLRQGGRESGCLQRGKIHGYIVDRYR